MGRRSERTARVTRPRPAAQPNCRASCLGRAIRFCRRCTRMDRGDSKLVGNPVDFEVLLPKFHNTHKCKAVAYR